MAITTNGIVLSKKLEELKSLDAEKEALKMLTNPPDDLTTKGKVAKQKLNWIDSGENFDFQFLKAPGALNRVNTVINLMVIF